MNGWWTAAAATMLAFLGYVAFFWKISWVRRQRQDSSSRKAAAGYVGTNNRKIGKIPPVYPNGWFALLESWQLKKEEVKHVAALGENFAVFRTKTGEVNILDAYCPHLGANMAEGGMVKGDCLECPFHSWLFLGKDGQCQSIPYSAKAVPTVAKTKAWGCCEVNHIIFVWYHAESAHPYWRPQPLESISNGTWWNQGRNEFLVNSHIQEIPENGADWAHLSAVHGPAMFFNDFLPGFMRHSWTEATWAPRTWRKVTSDCDDDTPKLNTARTNSEDKEENDRHESETHRATMTLHHAVVLLEQFSILQLDVTAEQIGPGYVELILQTSLGPMCILQTVTPVEPLLQRVTHVMFSPPLLGPYAKIVLLGESMMFERDIAVWNHKKFQKNPILVSEDCTIRMYRKWYKQFYSQNSPKYQSSSTLEF